MRFAVVLHCYVKYTLGAVAVIAFILFSRLRQSVYKIGRDGAAVVAVNVNEAVFFPYGKTYKPVCLVLLHLLFDCVVKRVAEQCGDIGRTHKRKLCSVHEVAERNFVFLAQKIFFGNYNVERVIARVG